MKGVEPLSVSGFRLLDMGPIGPFETQAIYHTIALAVGSGRSPSTLILCWPSSPLVCIGYHQVADVEVSLERCAEKGYPVVRRMLGGGAVLLNSDQLFYQIACAKDHPSLPGTIEGLFRKFLEAPTQTYRDLGIPADYKPVNDIEVDGRKISGNGGGEIEGAQVLTGNIIFDFPIAEMVDLLKVPDEKFRDKLRQGLSDRMTSIVRQLGVRPSVNEVKPILVSRFSEVIGEPLVPGELTAWEADVYRETTEFYKSPDWLNLHTPKASRVQDARKVKISARTRIANAAFKAPGGLIRVLVDITDDAIGDMFISGDYFITPLDGFDKLGTYMAGTPVNEDEITKSVRAFFESGQVDAAGISPEDIAKAIMAAASIK